MSEIKKIAIVMPYFNRLAQLEKTLDSIDRQNTKNVVVVIVDDNSDFEIMLWKKYKVQIDIIRIGKEKKWCNPEPAYNIGIAKAVHHYGAEIIMLQNPECLHVGEVLEYVRLNSTPENYITFGCAALDTSGQFKQWYNHPVYRPVAYEFCAAIYAENLVKLNGYDERLSNGLGYGDDYILFRIKLLGLRVEITSDPVVYHQWHPQFPNTGRTELFRRNKNIYERLISNPKIKAIRIYTENLAIHENISNRQ